MDISANLFLNTHPPDKIINKIKNGEWNDIINGMCNIKNNHVILDNNYFKYFAAKETYEIIISHIAKNIDNILTIHEDFIVHVNMKNLTVSDINKHLTFIQNMSVSFKNRYPNKLTKCYVYNAPFVFSKIINVVALFIDKETREKIEVLSKDNASTK